MSDVTMEIIAVVALVFTTISVVLGLQRMRKKGPALVRLWIVASWQNSVSKIRGSCW